MMMKQNLIQASVDLIRDFNPLIQTVSSFADDKLNYCEGDPNAPPEKIFCREILYGCVRCKEFLKVFLVHLFTDLASKIERADYTFYMVLGYILLYRLKEIGIDKFKAVVNDQDPLKICAILEYIMNLKVLHGNLMNDWLSIYDSKYIETAILEPIEHESQSIKDYCIRLQLKLYGKGKTKDILNAALNNKPTTIIKPFNLTKPNPRKIPEPTMIKSEFKVGPEPKYLKTSKDLEAILTEKEERFVATKELTMEKYIQAEQKGCGPFKFHETRTTVDEVRKELEAERTKDLTFCPKPAKPVPIYTDLGPEVRLNTGAILREDALLKKKQAKDASIIKAYEEELRDSTEFYQWQTKIREHDKHIKNEQVEEKRLRARATAAAARAAVIGQEMANKKLAQIVKEEKALITEQKKADEELQLLISKKAVRDISMVRDTAPKIAAENVLMNRKAIVTEIQTELTEREKVRLELIKMEQKERKDHVLKLKEAELHERFAKVFDPTETSGIGLLEEMSISEMKERLSMNEILEKQLEEQKRNQIVSEKTAKEMDLLERLEKIKKMRMKAAELRKMKRQKEMTEKLKIYKADKEKATLNKRAWLIEDKKNRIERENAATLLADEESEKQKSLEISGNDLKNRSIRILNSIEKGQNRRENLQKKEHLALKLAQSNVEQKNCAQIKANLDRIAFEEKCSKRQREIELARQKIRALEILENEYEEKKKNYQDTVKSEKCTKTAIAIQNKYADKISKLSISRARTHVSCKIPLLK